MAAAGAESRISAINEINSENILFIRIRRLPFSSFHIHSDLIGNICERARREKLQQKIRKKTRKTKTENFGTRVQTANVFHISMSHSKDDLIVVEFQSCDSWPMQTTKSNL